MYADASLNMANYYYPMLDALSSKAKLYLVRKLMDSLLKSDATGVSLSEAEKDAAFGRLAGVWANDVEASAMQLAIENGRAK